MSWRRAAVTAMPAMATTMRAAQWTWRRRRGTAGTRGSTTTTTSESHGQKPARINSNTTASTFIGPSARQIGDDMRHLDSPGRALQYRHRLFWVSISQLALAIIKPSRWPITTEMNQSVRFCTPYCIRHTVKGIITCKQSTSLPLALGSPELNSRSVRRAACLLLRCRLSRSRHAPTLRLSRPAVSAGWRLGRATHV